MMFVLSELPARAADVNKRLYNKFQAGCYEFLATKNINLDYKYVVFLSKQSV